MTSEYRRQHPVAALSSTLKAIRRNFITFIIVLWAGQPGGENSQFDATFLLILLGFMLIWGVVSWYRFLYYLKDGALWIEQGVFVRRQLYLPQERIQLIDFKSDFIQRMFGLVSLRVQTAGGSQDTEISALTKDQAEWIRSTLRADEEEEFVEQQSAAEQAGSVSPDSDPAAAKTAGKSKVLDRIHLPFRHLLLAGVTSASLGIAFSVIGAIMAQFDQVLSESEMLRYVEGFISTDFGFIATILAALIVVSLILAFLGTVIRYYDFSVTKYKNELVIERGFFERSSITIPYHRIQAIRFQEGIMRQPLGYGSILIDSAGFAEENGQTTMLFPIIRTDKVKEFINRLVPEYNYELQAGTPPRRAMRRFLIPKTIFFVLLFSGVSFIWDPGIYSFILLPLIWYWGYMQYRDTALAFTGSGKMALRFRQIARTTVLLEKRRIQDLNVSQNPFQRRGKVDDIQITAASGPNGVEFAVENISNSLTRQFWSWFSGDSLYYESTQLSGEKLTRIPSWM